VRLVWPAMFGLFAPGWACDPDGPRPEDNVGLTCLSNSDCAPPASICCNKTCTAQGGQVNGQTICGSCTTTCPSSQGCCKTAGEYSCTSESNDIYNCGRCGNICSPSEDCIDGICQPPSADSGSGGGDSGGGDGASCTGSACDSGVCAPLGSWQECTMNVPSNPGGGCCPGLTCGYGYTSGASGLELGVCCVSWGAAGCTHSTDCCAFDPNVLPTCNSGKCCVASGAPCDSVSGGTPCCSGVCAVNASNAYVCQ